MYKRLGNQGGVYFKQFDAKDIGSVADSIKDMDISSQNIIDDSLEHSCYQEYIDNVTTAYRSEIMTAIIRHDN